MTVEKAIKALKQMKVTCAATVLEELDFTIEVLEKLEKAGVNSDNAIKKTEWIIDKNIPIFKGENRKYINELILYNEDEIYKVY